MSLQVAWDKLSVQVAGQDEGKVLRRGQYLPDDLDEFQRETLLSIGAVRFVDERLVPVPAESIPITPAPIPEPPEGEVDTLEFDRFRAAGADPVLAAKQAELVEPGKTRSAVEAAKARAKAEEPAKSGSAGSESKSDSTASGSAASKAK
jgi:hypothetical protein